MLRRLGVHRKTFAWLLTLSQVGAPVMAADPPWRLSRILPWSTEDVGRRPETGRDVCVEELARNIDWLEHQLNQFGTVVAKSPDIWGQARMTAHRQEFEEQLKKELTLFNKNQINGAQVVNDQAFLAFAMAMQNQGGSAQLPPVPAGVLGTTVTKSDDGKTTTTTSSITPIGTPPSVSSLFTGSSGTAIFPAAAMAGGTGIITLEQTETLDQLARYVNHLHELRRINEGDDVSDSPGYSMNLVRIPVSLLPGQNTKQGYGAEITVTAEPYLGPELLPMAYRDFVVNDLVDQLSLYFTRFINEDPDTISQTLIDIEKLITKTPENLRSDDSVQLPAPNRRASGTGSLLLSGHENTSAPDGKRIQLYNLLKPGGNGNQESISGMTRNQVKSLLTKVNSIKINLSTASRKASFPFPPSQLTDSYGSEVLLILKDVYEAFRGDLVKKEGRGDLLNREVIHITDMQAFVREELVAAYELMKTEKMQKWWHEAELQPKQLADHIRLRRTTDVDKVRERFFAELEHDSDNTSHVTAWLSWCIYVESLLLNERLNQDIRETLKNKPTTVVVPDWLAYFGTNPCDEARQAFAEYARVRWPIHVFTLDPIVNEQNIADVSSFYRQMQMAVALGFSSDKIGLSAAMQAMRKLQRDRATIELNRTAVGFSHGDDTFGWRFYPRFQNPPVQGNATVFFKDLLVGGPTDRQLDRVKHIEPGMRECVAIVVMPSFVPHVTFTTRGNWFRLDAPGHTQFSVHDSVKFSRAVKAMETNAAMCVQCAHLYRDGEVDRLLKRVHQLDRRLPMQSLECQVPTDNDLGGFEIFSTGTRELSPELHGWYGSPGYDQTRGCTLYLAGEHFSVTQTNVLVGNRPIKARLLSRQVMEVTLPPGLPKIPEGRLAKMEPPAEMYDGFVDAHVATPYGVSGHLLIPAVKNRGGIQQAIAMQAETINATVTLKQDGTYKIEIAGSSQSPIFFNVPAVATSANKAEIVFYLRAGSDQLRQIAMSDQPRTTDNSGYIINSSEIVGQFAGSPTAPFAGTKFQDAIVHYVDYLAKNSLLPSSSIQIDASATLKPAGGDLALPVTGSLKIIVNFVKAP